MKIEIGPHDPPLSPLRLFDPKQPSNQPQAEIPTPQSAKKGQIEKAFRLYSAAIIKCYYPDDAEKLVSIIFDLCLK